MKIEGLHEKGIFDQNFPFRLFINNQLNFNYPSHWHNAVEMIYILEHNFTAIVNSRKYKMHKGDVIYIPGGDIHEFCSEMPIKCIFINFELSSLNHYSDMERICTQLRDVRLITPQDGELHANIEAEIDKIRTEWENSGFAQELYYTARMIDIVVMLCRSIPYRDNLANLKNMGGKSAGLEKINRSFEYIEKNYTEDIHLKDIARAAGFSEYYFSRLFKEITEKNFHQYLNEFRIKKAENLLMDSNYTISEAAYAVGFSSLTTFDRLFRQIKGCSPQKFRKLRVQ